MSDLPTHTVTTTTTTSSSRAYLDISYVKTFNGLLKVIQIVLSFITFIICVCVKADYQWRAGWSAFVSFFAFFLTAVLLCLYIFHVIDVFTKVPWVLIELVYYGLITFFFFIAGIVMAMLSDYFNHNYYSKISSSYKVTPGIGSFFCFVCVIAFGLDIFLQLRSRGLLPQRSNA